MTLPRLCIALALAATASSQSKQPPPRLLWERTGMVASYGYMENLIVTGDFDKDGIRDLLAPATDWTTYPPKLIVHVLSARTGSILVSHQLQYNRGARVYPAGDVDLDGVPDLMGFEGPALTGIRSGASGTLLRTFLHPRGPRGSWFNMLGDLDVDGDSRADCVLSSRNYLGAVHDTSEVVVFDNAGNELYRREKLGKNIVVQYASFGLAKVGDVNRDGCDDFAVAAQDVQRDVSCSALVSGKSGSLLAVGYPDSPLEFLYAVYGCGDIDRDGVIDFVGAENGYPTGIVYVFSGRDGSRIRRWAKGPSFGKPVAGGCDFDGDGILDLAVGARDLTPKDWGAIPSTGQVFGLSGRDGTEIFRLDPNYGLGPLPRLGGCVVTVPTLPGRKFPQFVTVESEYGPWQVGAIHGELGRVRMWTTEPDGTDVLGFSCSGILNAAPQAGVRRVGDDTTRLFVTSAPPGRPVFAILGASRQHWGSRPLPADITSLGFPSCNLFVSVDVVRAVVTGTQGIDRGFAQLDFPVVLDRLGTELYAQWFAMDPAIHGGGVSNAMSFHVR